MSKKISRKFYKTNTLNVAKKLLGKFLVVKKNGRKRVGMIVETEAYIGPHDRAAHSFGGRRTPRTEIEFKEGGYVYIYMVYGMYWQFNVVTEGKEKPECVLIRAIEPVKKSLNSKSYILNSNSKKVANGPGKLCEWFGLDKSFYGEDVTVSKRIWLEDRGARVAKKDIVAAKRVNIDYAKHWKHKLWRFYVKENEFVSKK